ncbi:hypothetical protein pipiens_014655 [Culex pipiens pipiens]|uniref:Uncharacterized protein n=1 Tax=Culex pipiens pipiens TaxID=38569 RepID=A0ABD1CTW1_CULPP
MSEQSDSEDGDGSFLTESESEHDSTWGEDKSQKDVVDYTATAKEIICENVNITTENALKLNSGYHNMLKILKNKLEILLGQCQERQKEIEKQIDEYRNAKRPVARKSRTSGYICGQPFFKDEDLYPGPHNDDYLTRKNVGKEFFPLDLFEVTDTNWTVKDKVNILKGVKTQIVEFIERENRLKIRKVGNGLEAERLRREIASLGRKEIGDLWEKVLRFPEEYPDQRFEIDWLRISNVNISERHSEAPAKKTRAKKVIGLPKNKLFCDTLRCAMKKKLYEKFLYSFHFRFGDQYPDVENKRVFCNQQVVCILLNCPTQYEAVATARHNFTLNELKSLRTSFSIQLNAALGNFLQNCTSCFLMPPNYNTILGLRGVVLHANYPKPPPKPSKKELPPPTDQLDEFAYQHALQAFRARFRSIFLWTMLLARQNPRDADFQNVVVVADDPAAQQSYEHDYQAQLDEQISLQQLVQLATTRPEPPPPPPPICQPTGVESLRKVRISRATPRSVYVEEMRDDDSLDGIVSPEHQHHQPEVLPSALQSTVATTQTVEAYCLDEDSNQLSLVSQITVINPGDLPIVELPQLGVEQQVDVVDEPVVEELPRLEEGGDELVEEEEDTRHDPAEETFSADEVEDESGQFGGEEVGEQDSSNQDDQLVSDRQEEPVQNEPIELTTTTTSCDTSQAECTIAAEPPSEPHPEPDLGTENLTISSTSLAHVTAVTNVGDFVIEELEETDYCEEVVAQTSCCDEPLDLHMSPVATQEVEEELVPTVRAPRKTYSRAAGRSSQRLSDRQEQVVVKPVSHAWRWTHLDGEDEVEIEGHRELWERCDPARDEFRVVQSDYATDLAEQQRDEVIVIDDEIEIKEEPLDVEEDNLIDVQLPPEENQVDESTIQQIIQTASNILRISETYRLDQSSLPPPPPPPPPPPVPEPEPLPTCESFRSVQSGPLVVQTPSRIFDEESNCYYYVDEVQEESGMEIAGPEVEINPTGKSTPFASQTLEDLLQDSLQATYAVMPQFATPQRVVEPFEAIPITRTPNRTQSTYGGRRTRAMMAMEEMYSPAPPINRPKRPPREPEIANPAAKHNMQVKALTQLDALSKQPRLPPRPSSALSMDQLVLLEPTPTPKKRPHSSQQTRPPKPKRTRTQHLLIEPVLPTTPTIKQEPLDLLANAEQADFSAVDIIDALNSMSQRMKQERLSDDDDDDVEDDKSSIQHLVTTPQPPPVKKRRPPRVDR